MDYKTTTANLGCCAMTPGGCEGCDRNQMSSYDWLNDIPESLQSSDLVTSSAGRKLSAVKSRR